LGSVDKLTATKTLASLVFKLQTIRRRQK